MNEKVVYFSLCRKRKASFYRYIKNYRICYEPKFSFELEGEKDRFLDPRDLIGLIERSSKKDSLHIIIDYVSCCDSGKETNYASVIRDIIMCYPEVQFLFDETFVRKSKDPRNKNYSFLNFLFWKAEVDKDEVISSVLPEYHQFDLKDFDNQTVRNSFIQLLKGCNNMFDASNLRYAIKRIKFRKLDVKRNYENLEDSRSCHAAVVVEEEYHQNMFNSYGLYANGFRVFPIVTATELLWINKIVAGKKLKEADCPLLLRDYDLQFVDENLVLSGVEKGADENEIDYIRGAKELKPSRNYKLITKDVKGGANPYWRSFKDDSIFFVSKGDANIEIDLGYEKAIEVGHEGDSLLLRGLKKPLEGIYASVKKVESIKSRFIESRDKEKFNLRRQGDSGHSCPLDIYGIARLMVHRAEDYYRNGHNRLAALVAGEALEVLNGFHRSLMSKAFYIQSVAENAMAMSLLGGDENVLRDDINLRLNEKVKDEVKRMIPNEEDRYNLLYNIFNDCMLFCQDKEYFDAADEALSVMVREKDGITLVNFFKFIWRKTKGTIKTTCSLFKVLFGR